MFGFGRKARENAELLKKLESLMGLLFVHPDSKDFFQKLKNDPRVNYKMFKATAKATAARLMEREQTPKAIVEVVSEVKQEWADAGLTL